MISGAMQEAAVESLALHSTRDRIRLLTSPTSSCAAVLWRRLKEEEECRYILATQEVGLDDKLEAISKAQEDNWHKQMEFYLQQRKLLRDERRTVDEAIRSLSASLERLYSHTSLLRHQLLQHQLQLVQQTHRRHSSILARMQIPFANEHVPGDMSRAPSSAHSQAHAELTEGVEAQEVKAWHPPLVIPEIAPEIGDVSWTHRSFAHLDGLAPPPTTCYGPYLCWSAVQM